MSESEVNRERTMAAFRLLADKLKAARIEATIYTFGGASIMMTATDDEKRDTTKDIDARIRSSKDVMKYVWEVADELKLPRWWLNEQGTVYLPREDDPHPRAVFDHSNLRVLRPSDRHLLAMKVDASRGGTEDSRDIKILARRLGLRTPDEVIAVHDEVFPDTPLSELKREVVKDAIGNHR